MAQDRATTHDQNYVTPAADIFSDLPPIRFVSYLLQDLKLYLRNMLQVAWRMRCNYDLLSRRVENQYFSGYIFLMMKQTLIQF